MTVNIYNGEQCCRFNVIYIFQNILCVCGGGGREKGVCFLLSLILYFVEFISKMSKWCLVVNEERVLQ